MKFKHTLSFLIAVLLFTSPILLTSCESKKDKLPEPTEKFFINDFADVINDNVEQQIYSIGAALSEKTKAQVVAVTVNSLEGFDLEEYSYELAEKWQIGDKDKDNGVLILIDIDGRQSRIEVGYGLEETLTDLETFEIQKNYMNPYFKQGDYSTGLSNAYKAVVLNIYKFYGITDTGLEEDLPLPENNQNKQEDDDSDFPAVLLAIIIVVIVFLASSRKGPRPPFGGGGGYRNKVPPIIFTSGRNSHGGGFGGFGGGGSSGGGFSGGGGSFGGGGSSNSW